jgi:hypothetical protein
MLQKHYVPRNTTLVTDTQLQVETQEPCGTMHVVLHTQQRMPKHDHDAAYLQQIITLPSAPLGYPLVKQQGNISSSLHDELNTASTSGCDVCWKPVECSEYLVINMLKRHVMHCSIRQPSLVVVEARDSRVACRRVDGACHAGVPSL